MVPDVFVRRTEHGWAVEINPATLPRVRLNQSYASLIGRNASHATMRAQLQEARWLLKSLEIRNETLIKVARSIVERQTAFLEQGEEHMRPMILKDIAEAVDMHESTISRVTSGKYMHTPRGVFELRYFFSSQVEGADGSGTSSTAIRAKIRKLVKDEDAESPLSDGRIAELLSAEGIPVARRTVAKYREAHGHRALERAPANRIQDRCKHVRQQRRRHMQLNVTGHHVEVTPALRGYVEKKLERIVRHFDQVIDVHCVLTVEKLRTEGRGDAARERQRDPRRRHRGQTCTPPSTCWRTSSTAASRSTRKSSPTITPPKRAPCALTRPRAAHRGLQRRGRGCHGACASSSSAACPARARAWRCTCSRTSASTASTTSRRRCSSPSSRTPCAAPSRRYERTAIGLDARNTAAEIATVPKLIDELKRSGIAVRGALPHGRRRRAAAALRARRAASIR